MSYAAIGADTQLSTPVSYADGGTAQTTRQAAIDALLANAALVKGDIFIVDASANVVKLAVGTDNQILKIATDIPNWENESAGSLTPWTEDIDADGWDLKDLSNIEFRDSTGVPAGTVTYITSQAGGSIVQNVPTGEVYHRSINGGAVEILSSTSFLLGAGVDLDLQNNAILNGGAISCDTITIVDANDIVVGTTTGTKIGTGTTQKLGFWNVTPVVQPGHIADPTGGSTIDTECRAQLVLLLSDMAELGLQAAS